jgi:glutathione S-transferase
MKLHHAGSVARGTPDPAKPPFVLVSHVLCPYVQRALIVLHEKGVAYERRDIDLDRKPDWFAEISPLGKTPVLLVGDEAIFESAVICEYLDEVAAPRLHPADPLDRARHRGWMEFGSSLLNSIAAFYNAVDEEALAGRARQIRARFEQLEAALGAGPYFNGSEFSIVDAVFGPVFRYVDVFETLGDFAFLAGLPRVGAWRVALSERSSVRQAVRADYPVRLRAFLSSRRSALSRRIAEPVA